MTDIQPKAISLFSGAGGMDIGFEQAGYKIVWANDFDVSACLTYEKNLGPKIVHGDIREHLHKLKSFYGVDVIFGGPPCQGFSVAGKMDPEDERSTMVWSFMEAVEVVRPRAFVMENVKALATLSKFSRIREALFQSAHKLGYTTNLVILNSKDFGVPQSRERMFFVGFQEKIERFDFFNISSHYQKKSPLVRDVIIPLGKAGTEKNSRICKAKISIAAKPVLRKSPYAGMLFNGQGRPINPDTHSSTLHASMGGNRTPIIDELHLFDGGESWVEEYHSHLMSGGEPYKMDAAPSFLRRLTVDEAIRLQTFPNNYSFQGKQSSVFRQIGNAVPCELAKGVACGVLDLLNGAEVIDIIDDQISFSFNKFAVSA